MILVDTTVWIDFFAGRPRPHVATLEQLLQTGEDICICGIVLAEVLQGIRSDSEYAKTKDYFESLVFLPMTHATFLRSSQMYRTLRKKGITIRTPLDCMIASVAIEHRAPLLHNDRDFDKIADHTNLEVVKSPKASRLHPKGRS
jgi:predicted nucleic acid-binding protein